MINTSYLVSHTNNIKFSKDKLRLRADEALPNELGKDGFTVVAFASNDSDPNFKVVGTASIKKWEDDGLWKPYNHVTADYWEESVNDRVDQNPETYACPGDYELVIVAIPPSPQFRGKGIAGRLVKACEEEILRRQKLKEDDISSLRIMVRVAKGSADEYWLKRGFTPVGFQECPKGFWDVEAEFTMWAMFREIPLY